MATDYTVIAGLQNCRIAESEGRKPLREGGQQGKEASKGRRPARERSSKRRKSGGRRPQPLLLPFCNSATLQSCNSSSVVVLRKIEDHPPPRQIGELRRQPALRETLQRCRTDNDF